MVKSIRALKMSLLEEGREEDEKVQGQSHRKELRRALPRDQPTR